MRSLQINSKFFCRFPPKHCYLVGVSGGRDSVALLHWLTVCGYSNLIVCHLNHQLRGRASDGDARFVQKLASKYDVDLELDSTNVRRLALKKKISIETAAREARYSFFAKVAERKRCHTIFLAHHADDLVETVLINFFRGAGPSGLIGMREVTNHRIGNIELAVVRPFLPVWRREIDEYVKTHSLDFREDASNKDLTQLRNRVRRRIIPYLEKTMGRNIRQNIWKTAMILAEEENLFETLIPNKLADAATLTVDPLRKMGLAMQRRVLHRWLRAADVPECTFDLIERVRGLLDLSKGVAKTNLPGNRHARRKAGKIFIE